MYLFLENINYIKIYLLHFFLLINLYYLFMANSEPLHNIVTLEQSLLQSSINESINIESSAQVILNQNLPQQSQKISQPIQIHTQVSANQVRQPQLLDQSQDLSKHQQNIQQKQDNIVQNKIQINNIDINNNLAENEITKTSNETIKQNIKPSQDMINTNELNLNETNNTNEAIQIFEPSNNNIIQQIPSKQIAHQENILHQNQLLKSEIPNSNNQLEISNEIVQSLHQSNVSHQIIQSQVHVVPQSQVQVTTNIHEPNQIIHKDQSQRLQQSVRANQQSIQSAEIKKAQTFEQKNIQVHSLISPQQKIESLQFQPNLQISQSLANPQLKATQSNQVPSNIENIIIQQKQITLQVNNQQKKQVEQKINQIKKQEVEINQIKKQEAPKLPTYQDLIAKANQIKTKGNQIFKDKNYQLAIKTYTQALHSVDPKLFNAASPQQYRSMIQLNLILLTNISSSYFQIKNYQVAERFSTQVLQINPKHFKAIYRRALCFYQLHKYEQSFKDIKQAYAIDPKIQVKEWYNKIYNAYKIQAQERRKSEKELYKVMFNKSQSQTSQRSQESSAKKQQIIKEQIVNKIQQPKIQKKQQIPIVPQIVKDESKNEEPEVEIQSNTSIKKMGLFAALGSIGSLIISRNIENSQQKLGLIATTTVGTALLGTENNFYRTLGSVSLLAAGYYLFNKFR